VLQVMGVPYGSPLYGPALAYLQVNFHFEKQGRHPYSKLTLFLLVFPERKSFTTCPRSRGDLQNDCIFN
jgi:hypothetical protein